MSAENTTILAHFIHPEKGVVRRFPIAHAPRVGDELRFASDVFYTVVRLLWVYDEPESRFSRLNIEIKEAA